MCANLEEFQADCIELCFSEFCSFKMPAAECMEQDISSTVQEKAKLVGFKTVTGRSSGSQMIFMFFYIKFHCSASAEDCVVDEFPSVVAKIGNDSAKG